MVQSGFRGQETNLYAIEIAGTGNQIAPNADMVVFNVGTTEHFFKPYSRYIKDGYVTTGFGTPSADGKVVSKVTAVVSGRTFDAIGLASHDANGGKLVVIDYHGHEGESGSGFTDEHGRLWLFSFGPGLTSAEDIQNRKDYLQATGKTPKIGFSFLSGPATFTKI